ncbi:MAG: transcription termination factor Rho [Olsenella sp.]|jgi:transcription termination factor Rho|nr:transcription termination factor Rho [Olsenella sp.]MCI1288802.1 transcription termination factor Rho [Olsenella sp.]
MAEENQVAGTGVPEGADADGNPSEEKPKRRRRVTRRAEKIEAASAESAQESGSSDDAEAKPRRTRRRAVRKADAAEGEPQATQAEQPEQAGGEAEAEPKPARRRGRPRKMQADDAADERGEQAPAEAQDAQQEPKPRRRGRRPKASADDAAPSTEDMTHATQEATHATAEVMAAPAATLAEADAAEATARQPERHEPDAEAREEHTTGEQERGEKGERTSQDDDRNDRPNHRRRRHNGRQDNAQGQNGKQGRNQRRRNRKNNQREQTVEPTLSRDEVAQMKVADLRKKAAELEIEYVGMRKKELAEAVYEAAAYAEGFRPVEGVLEFQNEGYAYVRTGNYMRGDNDAFVHQQMIRQYGLRPGDKVKGSVSPAKAGNKYPPLHTIELINDRAPEEAKSRPRFRDLTPIYPNERLVMEHGKDSITGRAIDLVAPIGKGQRGLIVSPPKAGKTTVLKKICQSIAANNPEVHLFCLLVDERPEEVTDMERSIRGEVVASTFDMPASNHTAVSELVIEHAKRLVEMGEDVVVVLDSITRLARAYNLAAPASGRILSGGVDSAALYPPKKFLGAARNIENGGSLTILASALVDTGSKMDEVIFEEFKGTGNMELKLDRELADRRIFPAIDPVASGTRNEDLLIDPSMQPFVWGIRRLLANMNNTERAAQALVRGLKATRDNEEFLIRSAKKAQQTEFAV